MLLPTRRARTLATLLAAAFCLTAQTAKRPLTHQDYDVWKAISNQTLSDDGRWLAYALFPQEGDGEVVLRNLDTGVERRFPAGAQPAASGALEPEGGEPAAGAGRGITLRFTSDGGYLAFTTFPSKPETEQARKDKKKPEEMPKGRLRIVPVSGSGEGFTTTTAVKSFAVAADNPRWLAYLREAPATPAPAGPRGTSASRGPRPEFGSELMLRDLPAGTERSFAEVLEFQLAKDGNTLVYAVSARKKEANGVFALDPARSGAQRVLKQAATRFERLAWNEAQTQLAFVSGEHKLYLWTRAGQNEAISLAADNSPGIPAGWVISERATPDFSKDGKYVFFATAPKPRPARASDDVLDKPVADLWHWKDDNVQSMQKVRAEQERNRSYRAMVPRDGGKVVQLADLTLADVNRVEGSGWALGTDDREYRQLAEFAERRTDHYIIDVATGARRLLLRNGGSTMYPSPDGRYALHYNGKDVLSLELLTGRVINLTSSLGVVFSNEEADSPSTPSSYGMAGWTKDSDRVLLYDRFDIWEITPDGQRATCLTDGEGRKQGIQFRYVRLDQPAESSPRAPHSIDPAQPLLLRAENLRTRETGFYQDRIGTPATPRKLLVGAKSFSAPVQAKKAPVLLLTASTFQEFPDLWTTDPDFQQLKKVSNANPQKEQFLWGIAETVRFTNLDGTPLDGVLYKPENFDPTKKYPLMVYIYERLSQQLHTFVPPAPRHSINISYYVSNGYLVLTPDIAYTIGYPGQSALKCVLPAVQKVVDQGFVNESAIGIQGHSWGGYQIAYMITQTNRFRAAAAGAPVANMTSAYDGIRYGTGLPRQFQYERTQSRIGGSLWQYPERFLENSPLFHADRVRTPLLMIHNDGDDAVPFTQGIEMFLALRRLGRETYLFNYNGEPHGLRKRPNQKDYTLRMQQYFDHHLKGAPKPEWMQRGIPYLEREQEKERWTSPPQQPAGSATTSGQ